MRFLAVKLERELEFFFTNSLKKTTVVVDLG